MAEISSIIVLFIVSVLCFMASWKAIKNRKKGCGCSGGDAGSCQSPCGGCCLRELEKALEEEEARAHDVF